MKAVASRVTDPKSDVLLLQAVDMEDSGPYEIAEPRVITALETYTPSWLQAHKPSCSSKSTRRAPEPVNSTVTRKTATSAADREE